MSLSRFLFLGTGGSMGVPLITCQCSVCRSELAANKRLRPSALVTVNDRNFLIDSGPDFRLQALHYQINKLEGVLFTHAHHDHTAGIDELRVFTLKSKTPLPCLISRETLRDLKVRFYYIFNEGADKIRTMTNLDENILEDDSGSISFQSLIVRYFSYSQGGTKVNGFRFGNLAYLTDIKNYHPEIFTQLKGLKFLIVGALRYTHSDLHFTVDEAVNFAKKVGAEQTWLTHIGHELDHERTNAYLPNDIRLSYDGLELFFNPEMS